MMGAAAQPYFDALRRAHFPAPPGAAPAPAHISLFRHLPPSAWNEIVRRVRAIAADYPAFDARLGPPFLLEKGVAFALHSPELLTIWHRLAEDWTGLLTGTDRADPRLHITVQNHRPRREALALLRQLQQDFQPRPVPIAGLSLSRHPATPGEKPLVIKFRGARRAY